MSCTCYVIHEWPHYYGPLQHTIKKCALCLCAPELLTALKLAVKNIKYIAQCTDVDVFEQLIELAQS